MLEILGRWTGRVKPAAAYLFPSDQFRWLQTASMDVFFDWVHDHTHLRDLLPGS